MRPIVGQEVQRLDRQRVQLGKVAGELLELVAKVPRSERSAPRQAAHHQRRCAEHDTALIEQERLGIGIADLCQEGQESEFARADAWVVV